MNKKASEHVRMSLRQAMARADQYRCVAIVGIPQDDRQETDLIVGGASNVLEVMGALGFAEQKVAEETARMRKKPALRAVEKIEEDILAAQPADPTPAVEEPAASDR